MTLSPQIMGEIDRDRGLAPRSTYTENLLKIALDCKTIGGDNGRNHAKRLLRNNELEKMRGMREIQELQTFYMPTKKVTGFSLDREIPKKVDERRKMLHRFAYLQHLLINALKECRMTTKMRIGSRALLQYIGTLERMVVPAFINEGECRIKRAGKLNHARLLALFGVSAWIIQMLIGFQGDECGFFIFLIELLRIIPMDNSCIKDEKLMELEQRLKVLEGRGEGMGIDKLTWAD